MDRLKKDLDHIKADGIDSGALYKRVCKYLEELAEYKDIGLTSEELALYKTVKDVALHTPAGRLVDILYAERDGRLVVLPEVPEDDRQAFVEGLHDYFQEAANYDPSVGIFGMRSGEAKLANALMDALRSPGDETMDALMDGLRRLEGEHGTAQV